MKKSSVIVKSVMGLFNRRKKTVEKMELTTWILINGR